MIDANGNEKTASQALALLDSHTQYYVPVSDLWAFEMAMEALALEVAKERNKRKCKYNIALKTEKHFHYIVEANSIESAIKKAKDAAAWCDFSDPECFEAISDECREATENDIHHTRRDCILTASEDEDEEE